MAETEQCTEKLLQDTPKESLAANQQPATDEDDTKGKNFIYLIGHSVPKLTPYTHINCASDPRAELGRHNNAEPSEGIRETKKAAGHWRLLLIIYVPPERQLDTLKLIQHWRKNHRTIPHRFMFGIRMAARLFLPCMVNDDVLNTPKMQAKLPERLYAKIMQRLRPQSQIVLQTNNNDDEPDSVQSLSSNSQQQSTTIQHLSDESIKAHIARYVENPHIVYKERHPNGGIEVFDDDDNDDDCSDNDEKETALRKHDNNKKQKLSATFLNTINTMPLTGNENEQTTVSATSQKSSTTQDNLTVCFTMRRNFENAASVAARNSKEQNKKTKPKATLTRKTSSKFGKQQFTVDVDGNLVVMPQKQRRQRKSMSLITELASVHQSKWLANFGDGKMNLDDVASNSMILAPLSRSAKLKRKRKTSADAKESDAVEKQITPSGSATLLAKYGDMLCDNMLDRTILASTIATSGDISSRCLCGAYRLPNARPVLVTVHNGERPTLGYFCSVAACGRFSHAYEKITFDLARFEHDIQAHQLQKQNQQPQTSETTTTYSLPGEHGDAANDGLDHFLESMMMAFTDKNTNSSRPAQPFEIVDDGEDCDDTPSSTPELQSPCGLSMYFAETGDASAYLKSDMQATLIGMRKTVSLDLLTHTTGEQKRIEEMFGI